MPNKRSRSKTALPRLSRDAERLVYLARSQDAAGSVVEFRFWDQPLRSEVSRLIEHNADQGIESALDFLFVTEAPGFDVLLEAVESQSEAPQLEGQQLLLVAAPILAWSKYSIFSGTLRRELQQSLEAALRDQVVATGAAVALAPYIFSIDQLPRRFSEVNNWTRALGARALGRESKLSLKNLPETIALLADTRFLIAAIAAPIGEPLFRWQEKPSGATPANREQILNDGVRTAAPALRVRCQAARSMSSFRTATTSPRANPTPPSAPTQSMLPLRSLSMR
jgi:hypothetical protein